MSRIVASYMSDQHHEHRTHYLEPSAYRKDGAQLAILAGDIDKPEEAIPYCDEIGLPAIYVMGNHEHYGRDYHQNREMARALAEQTENVHLLDPGVVHLEIDGQPVRVIGATLWTDYCLKGKAVQDFAMQAAQMSMNDHRLIRCGDDRFTPGDAHAAHRAELAFIRDELAKPFDGPTIVVTHHAPSIRCQDAKYATSSVAPAFCSDLEDFVAESGADLWVCGHTHGDCDFMLGNTRVVSNQHGYLNEKRVAMKTVEIPVTR
ncbi:hypothetical protein CKO28_02975 [Rhodovibrio sodomensis]|uniref:Calcineurin-like phosphoesterase domain-containing protein n=1 Tax=Rhodovibrio sodomensis TaxID=1088 RepID=A0ABS1D9B4_9PROT|nr:metallophosphoesterase [Rhodovibrio sodomensis]MBK1667006.1 hypothetical protein [Rhodovibrio sodomensis]